VVGIKASTALHDAAWNNNLDAIRILVQYGADLEAEDATYHSTPAGWARYAGKTEAYQLLVSLGAKP
jgi:ankyrin repeat protein